MIYEAPELIPLMSAINAIQSIPAKHAGAGESIHPLSNDINAAYEDWE